VDLLCDVGPAAFSLKQAFPPSLAEPQGVRPPPKKSLDWFVLAMITVVAAATPLGYLPVPGTAGFLTWAHIPVILGGILRGPIVGGGLGLLFGAGNLLAVAPHNPLVQILPRFLCGQVAGMVFSMGRKFGQSGSSITVGSLMAALAGSFVNTAGVVLLALTQGLMSSDEAISTLLFHGAPEALLAVLIALPLAVTLSA